MESVLAKHAIWRDGYWVPRKYADTARGWVDAEWPPHITEPYPVPRFQVGQRIRYRFLGGPYLTGEIVRIHWRLAERKPYQQIGYYTKHAGCHDGFTDDIPQNEVEAV
jgi:hypothetical protein